MIETRRFPVIVPIEWWEQVKDRRAPAAPFPRRQVQALLLRALHELEGEFSDLIRQRVACVMGDPGAKPPRSSGETLALRQGKPRPRSRPPAPPLRSEPTARPRPTTTAQTRSDERTRIRAAVLAVLADGRGRGRGDLLQASRLFESDVPALHAVLRALVAENLIEMIGQRGGTRYVARRPTDDG